jgi:phage host-nuclease inhibitor protein Gam
MSSRLKSTTTLTTRAHFEATVDEICKLQLDREQRVTLRDRLLQEIQEEHNPEIESISQDISAKLLLCEKYAETNRETLFGKLKSAAANLGTFGFRTGNPKLALLNRKWKWKDVLATVKAMGMTDCYRTKEEPDKDALKKLDAPELARVGLRIEQDEVFYIEPHRQNPERIQS